MNIVDFITARLDEDEKAAAAARDTFDPTWYYDGRVDDSPLWQVWAYDEIVASDLAEPAAIHIARHDPARVLREVSAKRVILAEHEDNEGQCARCLDDDGVWVEGGRTIAYAQPWPCRTIRALANVHVDHPDFVAEWKL